LLHFEFASRKLLSLLADGLQTLLAMERCFAAFAGLLISLFTLSAQVVSFDGTPISENFDSMGTNGTTTPPGWFAGPTNANGTVSRTTLFAGDGSTSVITNWNVGTLASTDRALGSQAGTVAGGDLNIEVRISNNTGSAISSFALSYDGEQWRANNATQNPQSLVMKYSPDGTNFVDMGASFNFISPVTAGNTGLNGNATTNRVSGLGGSYVPAQPIPNGAIFYLRWFDTNNSGNDHLLAIDNFFFALSGTTDIAIATPTNNQTFIQGNSITITATAGTAITNVAFYTDTTLIGQDGTRPFTAVYSNAPVGSHILKAVGQALSGSFTSAPVNITVIGNNPPSVTITNPANGAQFLVGSLAAVGASASDDSAVAKVDFYVNGVFRFSDATSAYLFNYNDLTAGNHTLVAVATDNGGLATTSAPVTINVTNEPNVTYLVTNGSRWLYLDDGSDQSNAWRTVFDDSDWMSGLRRTRLRRFRREPAGNHRHQWRSGQQSIHHHLFSTSCHDQQSRRLHNLIVRLLRDDGGIVYINDHEVFRSNMTNAPIDTYTNLALSASDDGVGYFSTNVNPSVLLTGENIIAVEIHQTTTNSTDLSFDLQLLGQKTGRAFADGLAIRQHGNDFVDRLKFRAAIPQRPRPRARRMAGRAKQSFQSIYHPDQSAKSTSTFLSLAIGTVAPPRY
jgi:hypothetical protein